MHAYKLSDRSIGLKLKKARLAKGLTYIQISTNLKIRGEILEKLENDLFEEIGDHVFVKGLLKNYAAFLNLNSAELVAVYKRDYEFATKVEPKDEKVEPTTNKTTFKPQLTFRNVLIIVAIFFILGLGYIIYRVADQTFNPPSFELTFPIEAKSGDKIKYVTAENYIRFSGKSSLGYILRLNGVVLPLKADLTFETDPIPFSEDQINFVISATSTVGSTSSITVEVQKQSAKTTAIEDSGLVGIVSTKTESVFLLIKVDDEIKFNDLAESNFSMGFTVKRSLEIQSNKPNLVTLTVDNNNFPVEKELEIYTVTNGKLNRN